MSLIAISRLLHLTTEISYNLPLLLHNRRAGNHTPPANLCRTAYVLPFHAQMETQEKSTFKDYLYSSKLPIQLITLARPIIVSQLEQISENKSLSYDDLGDDREKMIKKAISIFTNLQIVIEDLD